MAYKPWKVQEILWKEKCKWGSSQNKAFLVGRMAQRTGKSVVETLRENNTLKNRYMMIDGPEEWKMPESEQVPHKHPTSTEQVKMEG